MPPICAASTRIGIAGKAVVQTTSAAKSGELRKPPNKRTRRTWSPSRIAEDVIAERVKRQIYSFKNNFLFDARLTDATTGACREPHRVPRVPFFCSLSTAGASRIIVRPVRSLACLHQDILLQKTRMSALGADLCRSAS